VAHPVYIYIYIYTHTYTYTYIRWAWTRRVRIYESNFSHLSSIDETWSLYDIISFTVWLTSAIPRHSAQKQVKFTSYHPYRCYDTNKVFRDMTYLRSSYMCHFYYEGRPLYCNLYDTAVCHYGEGNCKPAWNLLDYTLDISVREVAAQVRRYVRVQVDAKAVSVYGVRRRRNFTYSSLQHQMR